MNIGYKVAIEGGWDAKGPDAVSHRPPDVGVEDLAHAWSACLGICRFDWQQGLVGEASQHQNKHKDAENTHGVLEAHTFEQTRQYEGQCDSEEAAAGRHDAIHQTQALLEVVAQND